MSNPERRAKYDQTLVRAKGSVAAAPFEVEESFWSRTKIMFALMLVALSFYFYLNHRTKVAEAEALAAAEIRKAAEVKAAAAAEFQRKLDEHAQQYAEDNKVQEQRAEIQRLQRDSARVGAQVSAAERRQEILKRIDDSRAEHKTRMDELRAKQEEQAAQARSQAEINNARAKLRAYENAKR